MMMMMMMIGMVMTLGSRQKPLRILRQLRFQLNGGHGQWDFR